MRRGKDGEWTPAHIGDDVAIDDMVETGPGAALQLASGVVKVDIQAMDFASFNDLFLAGSFDMAARSIRFSSHDSNAKFASSTRNS